jgi:enterochelin esterase family protein
MVADAEYAAHPEESAVLVFVGLPVGVDRTAQYTFAPVPDGYPTPEGELYMGFLVDTLLPKVTGAFQLCPRAEDHGVAGASLGGLISSYAAEQHPELFGFVGSQSGSYFVNTVVQDRIAQDPVLPLRFYLDHGCPGDNCDENRAFVAQLLERGYPVTHLEQTGAQHDWSYWEGRLPFLLQDFRKDRSGCAP